MEAEGSVTHYQSAAVLRDYDVRTVYMWFGPPAGLLRHLARLDRYSWETFQRPLQSSRKHQPAHLVGCTNQVPLMVLLLRLVIVLTCLLRSACPPPPAGGAGVFQHDPHNQHAGLRRPPPRWPRLAQARGRLHRAGGAPQDRAGHARHAPGERGISTLKMGDGHDMMVFRGGVRLFGTVRFSVVRPCLGLVFVLSL